MIERIRTTNKVAVAETLQAKMLGNATLRQSPNGGGHCKIKEITSEQDLKK